MTTRDPAAPDTIPPESEVSKGFGPERELDQLRQDNRRLQRDVTELVRRLKDSIENKAVEENARLRADVGKRDRKIAALENAIAPRATAVRMAAWLFSALAVVVAIIGWCWIQFQAIDARVRTVEIQQVELRAAAAKGAP